MKKKVFASDFDGTLYFYKAEVKLPPENVEKIRQYQAAGHLFGLCTGRQVGGLTPFITGLVRPDFYITSSGANIVDGDMKPILKRGVDRDVADALVRELNPKGYRLTLDVEGDICVFAPMDYPGKYYVITGVGEALDMPLDAPLTKLRVFIDRCSVELFANDGEATFTTHLYPTEEEFHYTLNGGSLRLWALAPSVTDEFIV